MSSFERFCRRVGENMKKLAACELWLAEYDSADAIYDRLLEQQGDSTETLFMKGEIMLAEGRVDEAKGYFERSFEGGFSTGGIRLASIYLDGGEIDSAAAALEAISEKGKTLLDYAVERAAVMKLRGEDTDSLIDNAIQRAINISNNAPQDPRPYVVLGEAYALLGDYEKSIHNYNTAYFLETSLYNQSTIQLEMGMTEDLLGTRARAETHYRNVLESRGGKYQKTLAEKYLETPYSYNK